MQFLSTAVLSFFDLIHSESKLLRKRVIDTVVIVILLAGAAIAVFAGIGLLLAALFDYLHIMMTKPWPSILVALLCFSLGGACTWIAYRLKS